MIEKWLLSLILLLCGSLGWFIKEMLSEIRGTQKEHGTSLSNIKIHVLRIEDKQQVMQGQVAKLSEETRVSGSVQRETKSTLDHSLYEMRQQIKEISEEQYESKKNFGKVIVIIQKLYAATRNGSSK